MTGPEEELVEEAEAFLEAYTDVEDHPIYWSVVEDLGRPS